MPDLGDLVRAAVEQAADDEVLEAYAEESRHTEASALRGEVEGLLSAESRGVGVRLISGDRLGYVFAADPTIDEVRAAVGKARENAALSEPDEFNLLPAAQPAPAIPELFDAASADVSTQAKVQMALDLEARIVSLDPRVTKIDLAQVGDAVSRVAVASTTGTDAEYARTDAWCVAVALAVEGDETQTGYSYRITRSLADVGPEAIADEAVKRSVRHAGRGEAAHREGARGPRSVRGDVVPRCPRGCAQRRVCLEGPFAVRRDDGTAGGLRAVHTRRRRHDPPWSRRVSVR